LSFGIFSPVLVCCTKKNLATLPGALERVRRRLLFRLEQEDPLQLRLCGQLLESCQLEALQEAGIVLAWADSMNQFRPLFTDKTYKNESFYFFSSAYNDYAHYISYDNSTAMY
jgi:hypothetical protein